jgi:hypothetical protein
MLPISPARPGRPSMPFALILLTAHEIEVARDAHDRLGHIVVRIIF